MLQRQWTCSIDRCVTDDGFSIQQAVDSLDPGGCVCVGAGVQEWEYTTTVAVNDNISFVGEEDSVTDMLGSGAVPC